MIGCGRLKNILYGFQPLPKQKILKLRSVNAQRCLFKNNLGQVTQQRKCKHRPPQPRKGQEQDTDSPSDQGENRI
jgi:hypothetical protein